MIAEATMRLSSMFFIVELDDSNNEEILKIENIVEIPIISAYASARISSVAILITKIREMSMCSKQRH